MGLAQVDRRPVHAREAGRDLDRQNDVGRLQWTHGDDHLSMEPSRGNRVDIRFVHCHILASLDMAERDAGIEITDLKGMTYNPVEGDWRLSRDLAVNYLAFGVKKGR